MKQKDVGKELHTIGNLIKRHVEILNSIRYAESLTGTNGWIIAYLYDHRDQDIFQKDIEETFEVTRSTASKVITLMEQKGLILRTSVPYDARLKKLTLTPLALKLHESIVLDIQGFEKRLTEGLSEQEIIILLKCLDKMKQNLR